MMDTTFVALAARADAVRHVRGLNLHQLHRRLASRYGASYALDAPRGKDTLGVLAPARHLPRFPEVLAEALGVSVGWLKTGDGAWADWREQAQAVRL
jgi:hypothetical protein